MVRAPNIVTRRKVALLGYHRAYEANEKGGSAGRTLGWSASAIVVFISGRQVGTYEEESHLDYFPFGTRRVPSLDKSNTTAPEVTELESELRLDAHSCNSAFLVHMNITARVCGFDFFVPWLARHLLTKCTAGFFFSFFFF